METLKRLVSKDGSVKYLFKLEDNHTVETLYMHDDGFKLTFNSTVCISSQVGCRVGCRFCATGRQGFIRNLAADEIFQQVEACSADCRQSGFRPLEAVVFAGMGEPMLNYENVKQAIDKTYRDLGIKDFEIVTVGIVPQIRRLIEDFKNGESHIRLNISLHASNDATRKTLIPYTSIYNISDIIEAAVEYSRAFNERVRMRYALFKGINDRDEDIDSLSRLLADKPVKLILSQYNDNHIPGLQAVPEEHFMRFYHRLAKRIDCGRFFNFGSDIKGGCGQLSQVKAV
ncbi:MAG: radical SAM protein [Clostridiales bacterium]|nr:radical SAM protein [Eubacteriales bacterium]MDH7566749.1 radical SAM protein [Clostridiales bacterium]